ncbi:MULTISPECIES: ArsA family ATPase [Cyanophyceae]|uniref:ArsA family ATPase n=1 Tax=Stenomitos frigidus AS-A4 TaxID=2933935 RepID=A0ABV0KNV5_9CYAN|nr:ArsA family ATPase [Phormidium sp. FACHB-592]
MELQLYDSLHLTMFSGKGGVGKTTLACGFARQWAQRFPDESILLLSTDPAHSLGDVLQMTVTDDPQPAVDLPNLKVRSLDAETLLQAFKSDYGNVLELLVERGSFVENEDLTPVWDLSWPGLDELMGILEIQRLLREHEADRVVVDMAPSGHTLNLFGLMDFLDEFLSALELFQEKHRVISQSFTGRYTADQADAFLQDMKADLVGGRQLLQNQDATACLVVAIAEPMSLLETQRFLTALETLKIPVGGVFVNRLVEAEGRRQEAEVGEAEGSNQESFHPSSPALLDRLAEQQQLLSKFIALADQKPIFAVPQQAQEPAGTIALDHLFTQIQPATVESVVITAPQIQVPEKILPGFGDFIAAGRQLILVGGKGGVGKTTVAAAIAWGMAERYSDRKIRVISIDPAHSLGDAFGQALGHEAIALTSNLSAQEVDAEQVLDQFRQDYLWELAEMMSGETSDGETTLKLAYGPEAWRKIVAQALPGIDEMLSLVTVMELLESKAQDLIVLDTAPTGHLLRFLEMPSAMGDWLAWIFKLWIKYQDVLGRTDLIGRLRTLRQRVMQAQKKLKDPKYTEFIGVIQAQAAITAEAQRLAITLNDMGMAQHYIVQNRFEAGQKLAEGLFSEQTIVHLPGLPRSISPSNRIQMAAKLLF